jgi:hypothetical protein
MRRPQDPLFKPDNLNYLQGNSFRVLFQRSPNTAFHLQSVNLPGVSISTGDNSTPGLQWDIVGNQLSFDAIDLEFIVDEDLANWLEIYDWLHEMSDPNLGKSTGTLQEQLTEMQLFIYTNSNNPSKLFTFHNVYPVSISSINFTTQSTGEPILATVSCNYTTYEMEPV